MMMNKETKRLFVSLMLAAFVSAAAMAQQPQQIAVPLSDPDQPAVLVAKMLNGSIEVAVHEGSEVLVETTMEATDERDDESSERRGGLRRIPNTSVGLTIEERSNKVTIGADWSARSTRLVIRVPRRTSLRLATVNNGDIEVSGVEGNHELKNVNGAISAIDVSGSVVASTTNGDVRVRFVTLEADKPMSFNSFNGDVDLTIPGDTRARLLINSGQGEILTDFDVAIDPQGVKTSREEGERGFRVRVEQEVVGSINGGGPDFRFKTYNGDIFIRRGGL